MKRKTNTLRHIEKKAGLFTYFTRRDPRNYVPVFAGMSPAASFGSGELNMATNVAGGLRDAGFNAVLYDPTPEKLRGTYAYLRRRAHLSPEEAMRAVMTGTGVSPDAFAREAALYRLGHNHYTMSPIEALKNKPLTELMQGARHGEFSPVLSQLLGSSQKETVKNFVRFKSLLDRGAFDGITPGGLRDHLLKGKEAILSGRVVLGDPRQLYSPEMAGKGRMFFDGHLGMSYRDLPFGKNLTVGSGKDLGQHVGFNANYTPGYVSDAASGGSVIPFTDVGRTVADRLPFVSKIKNRLARRDMVSMLSKELGVTAKDLGGKKLILLAGGAAGENIPLKMQQLHQALQGRKDAIVLVNSGNKDSVFGEARSLADKFNSVSGGPRYVVRNGFSPVDSRRFAGAVDLNLSYGGSSTLSETLANRNPSIFMSDTPLNAGNVGWAKARFGDKIHTFDSSGLAAKEYAISKYIDPDREGFFWRDQVRSRHVPGPHFSDPVPGITKVPALGEYRARAIPINPSAERSAFSARINDMLDNPELYRRNTGTVASDFIRSLSRSNKNIVNMAKKLNGGLYIGRFRLPWTVVRRALVR